MTAHIDLKITYSYNIWQTENENLNTLIAQVGYDGPDKAVIHVIINHNELPISCFYTSKQIWTFKNSSHLKTTIMSTAAVLVCF